MNTNGLAKHYGALSPEERFGLILAAGVRGDNAERDRIVNAGGRITLSMPDFSPWSFAFREIAWVSFAELLEDAAKYDDARERWVEAGEEIPGYFGELDDEAEDDDDEQAKADDAEAPDDSEQSHADRMFDLFMAQGYMVKVRGDGWKLFCDRLGVPPFLLWEAMPGLDRVKLALELAEERAFVPEVMFQLVNRIRPEDEPEATRDNLISAESIAEALDNCFRNRAKWHGAD